MRKKRLAMNTLSSLIFQISTIVCGFILPRLILGTFGSEVNGLVNSIQQFLQIIAFLELGVGAVVQSSLYEPLAEKNNEKISKIVKSASNFFNTLAIILLFYIVFLMFVYPHIANQEFGWIYTAGLIGAISISFFAQYYFGVVDRLLLSADQKGYIQYNAQTITIIINTVACVFLIKYGASIHVVKLATSIIYLARPIVLRCYVTKNYNIDRRITYTEEPITQKWNGVAQHVAAVILDGTDTVVLTILASLKEVSIYSVYHLVIYGVKQLFTSLTGGIQSLLGELWARKEQDELRSFFSWTEWVIHTGAVFIFGCTGMLLTPFIAVYTKGIYDTNYYQPLFAVLITVAQATHSLRLPYNIMIMAAGHYKETQKNYILAASINIVISIITVKLWGLVGVAIGTLVAMVYQTFWMAHYVYVNILEEKENSFFKQIIVDILTVLVGVLCTSWIKMGGLSYVSWAMLALKTTSIYGVCTILICCIFYKDRMVRLVSRFRNNH